MENRRLQFVKLLRVCFASIVFVLTIEICSRIDDKISYDAPFFGDYSSELLHKTDSEGLIHNIPSSRFEKWRTNALGFRGPEIDVIKPIGIVRIACMGTSETFGLYESQDKEWPAQLMDILKGFRRFEVINTSVVGLPLNKHIPYIKKYVLKSNPDIVILYVNPFSYAAGIREFSKRQDSGTIQVGIAKKRWRHFLSSLSFDLRMIRKLKQAWKGIIPSSLLRWYQFHRLKKELDVLEKSRLNGKRPIDCIEREKLTGFRTDLEEVIQFLKHCKIEVILSSYPALISSENIERYLEIFLDHRRFYIELSLAGIVDASRRFNDLMESVAIENNISFVDNEKYIPKNTEYFADNVHYTDRGAMLVAENFARFIKSEWME